MTNLRIVRNEKSVTPKCLDKTFARTRYSVVHGNGRPAMSSNFRCGTQSAAQSITPTDKGLGRLGYRLTPTPDEIDRFPGLGPTNNSAAFVAGERL